MELMFSLLRSLFPTHRYYFIQSKRCIGLGGVWDNLYRVGVVGDPLYRDNDIVYSNLTTAAYDNSTIKKWRFTKIFNAPSTVTKAPAGSVVLLEFDGIQTLATVMLNSKPLLTTANQFRQYRAVLPNDLLVRKQSYNAHPQCTSIQHECHLIL